jgi:plastocyanin
MQIEAGTWRRVVGAALVGAALATAGLAPVVAANGTTVKIHDFAFAPDQLTVKVGTTVTWINEDDIPHTVVATGKAFRSKALDTNDKFSLTFTAAGSYEYFCSLHPHMKATVTVQ